MTVADDSRLGESTLKTDTPNSRLAADEPKAWDWRKGIGGWTLPSDRPVRRFHAFDVNNLAACSPSHGLMASVEPPNEGSLFCEDCIVVVKAQPEGRPKREYPSD